MSYARMKQREAELRAEVERWLEAGRAGRRGGGCRARRARAATRCRPGWRTSSSGWRRSARPRRRWRRRPGPRCRRPDDGARPGPSSRHDGQGPAEAGGRRRAAGPGAAQLHRSRTAASSRPATASCRATTARSRSTATARSSPRTGSPPTAPTTARWRRWSTTPRRPAAASPGRSRPTPASATRTTWPRWQARGIAGYLMPGRARHHQPGDTGRRRIAPGSLMARMDAKLRRAGRRSPLPPAQADRRARVRPDQGRPRLPAVPAARLRQRPPANGR